MGPHVSLEAGSAGGRGGVATWGSPGAGRDPGTGDGGPGAGDWGIGIVPPSPGAGRSRGLRSPCGGSGRGKTRVPVGWGGVGCRAHRARAPRPAALPAPGAGPAAARRRLPWRRRRDGAAPRRPRPAAPGPPAAGRAAGARGPGAGGERRRSAAAGPLRYKALVCSSGTSTRVGRPESEKPSRWPQPQPRLCRPAAGAASAPPQPRCGQRASASQKSANLLVKTENDVFNV